MLEFGAGLEPPDFEQLVVNSDTDSLRDEIGSLIGIEENAGDARVPWKSSGLEANLGHAAFFCFQTQGEIDNRDLLFHRQGEDGIAPALRDTIPYFLGAAPRNQSVRRQELSAARRELRRAEADLGRALALDEEIDVSLLSMVREASTAGLLEEVEPRGRAEMFQLLSAAVAAPSVSPSDADDVSAARREVLERQRSELRIALQTAGAQVEILRSAGADENAYEGVVDQQISRLASIGLFEGEESEIGMFPVCTQKLPNDDPSGDQLRLVASELTAQLEDVESIRPRRSAAIKDFDKTIDDLRQELRAVDAAIIGIDEQQRTISTERSTAESQAFTRGRLQQFLDTTKAGDPNENARLSDLVEVRRRDVEGLEADLDPDSSREELNARLAVVAGDLTSYSRRLELEYHEAVWLDVQRLTVMTETDQGAAPLFRIGSGDNWVGSHLAAHLALHRYFTRHDRPVPRFLMLDQPSQAYYPSELEREGGVPEGEDDRAAVRRIYELMRDVAEELAPDLQIIVCDHANLPEDWFQGAVRHNWRGGEKLIPQDWIDRKDAETSNEKPNGDFV
jgi:hypothetical protein